MKQFIWWMPYSICQIILTSISPVLYLFFFFFIQSVVSFAPGMRSTFFFLITWTFWLLYWETLDPSKIFYFSKQSPFLCLACRYWPTFLSYSSNDNLIFRAFEMLFFICIVFLVAPGLLLIPAGAICEAENTYQAGLPCSLGLGRAFFSAFGCLWAFVESLPELLGHLGWLLSVFEGKGGVKALQTPLAERTPLGFLFAGLQFNQGRKGPTCAAFSVCSGFRRCQVLICCLLWWVEWEFENVGAQCISSSPVVPSQSASSFHLLVSCCVIFRVYSCT